MGFCWWGDGLWLKWLESLWLWHAIAMFGFGMGREAERRVDKVHFAPRARYMTRGGSGGVPGTVDVVYATCWFKPLTARRSRVTALLFKPCVPYAPSSSQEFHSLWPTRDAKGFP
ncbi:hypothetical protein OF83DRAFT_1138754 [Amylostereum chailletii]|nr:hypothetical protein OF83DRAFT_1138754 [Amylostereum chailletii]